jgi:hypothetical protein
MAGIDIFKLTRQQETMKDEGRRSLIKLEKRTGWTKSLNAKVSSLEDREP